MGGGKSNSDEREKQDQADFELILKAYKHRGYDKGARSIYMRLLHDRTVMNIKKIRRLMKNIISSVRFEKQIHIDGWQRQSKQTVLRKMK